MIPSQDTVSSRLEVNPSFEVGQALAQQILRRWGRHYRPLNRAKPCLSPNHHEESSEVVKAKLSKGLAAPFRDPYLGDENQIQHLFRLVSDHRLTVVRNQPGNASRGLGKRRLVSELIRRYGTTFSDGVYWWTSDNHARTIRQIASFYQQPDGASDSKSLEECVALVLSRWQQANKLLLIVEAGSRPWEALDWLPNRDGVHTLVISPNKSWPQLPNSVEYHLEPLAKKAVVTALGETFPEQPQDCRQLANLLQGNPFQLKLVRQLGHVSSLSAINLVKMIAAQYESSKRYRDPNQVSRLLSAHLYKVLAQAGGDTLIATIRTLAFWQGHNWAMSRTLDNSGEFLAEHPHELAAEAVVETQTDWSLLERAVPYLCPAFAEMVQEYWQDDFESELSQISSFPDDRLHKDRHADSLLAVGEILALRPGLVSSLEPRLARQWIGELIVLGDHRTALSLMEDMMSGSQQFEDAPWHVLWALAMAGYGGATIHLGHAPRYQNDSGSEDVDEEGRMIACLFRMRNQVETALHHNPEQYKFEILARLGAHLGQPDRDLGRLIHQPEMADRAFASLVGYCLEGYARWFVDRGQRVQAGRYLDKLQMLNRKLNGFSTAHYLKILNGRLGLVCGTFDGRERYQLWPALIEELGVMTWTYPESATLVLFRWLGQVVALEDRWVVHKLEGLLRFSIRKRFRNEPETRQQLLTQLDEILAAGSGEAAELAVSEIG